MADHSLAALGFAAALLGACASTPADRQPTSAAKTAKQPTPVKAPVASDGCDAFEADLCVAACIDSNCMEWCAGETCVPAFAETAACGRQIEADVAAAVGPQPSGEEDAALEAWENALESGVWDGWNSTCRDACTARFDGPTAAELCDHDVDRVEQWTQVATPGSFGSTGVADGALSSVGESTHPNEARLANEQTAELEHPLQLALMVVHQSGALDLTACLQADGQAKARVDVSFDPDGSVSRATAQQPGPVTDCLAGKLELNLRLPRRVAAETGTLTIDLVAAPGFG